MTGVAREEVLRIAKLARLKLTEEEAALYQGQFSRILELMAELSRLDASAPAAPVRVAGSSNVMREDSPEPFPQTERLLALAPEREGGYYKVKKVIA